MTYLSCPDAPAGTDYATVHIAWELSKADWKLGVLISGAQQMSRFTVKGGDLAAASARLAAARAKAARSGLPVRILSCYEAGFEGHWLHRWLESQGVVSHEVDPSSIEVNRRARRAKTDRIDLARIMRAFLAHLRGEPLACSIVHVPSPDEEDDKRPSRERERLLKERTGHTNRIKSLLHAQGIRDAKPLARDFLRRLETARTGDGRPLPPRLAAEIARERERLVVVDKQIAAIEADCKAECRCAGIVDSEDRAARAAQRPRDHRRAGPRQGGVLPPLRQPPAGRRLRRTDGNALQQRSATRASARRAIGAPAPRPSSSPGGGPTGSPTASSPDGSRRGSETAKAG